MPTPTYFLVFLIVVMTSFICLTMYFEHSKERYWYITVASKTGSALNLGWRLWTGKHPVYIQTNVFTKDEIMIWWVELTKEEAITLRNAANTEA